VVFLKGIVIEPTIYDESANEVDEDVELTLIHETGQQTRKTLTLTYNQKSR
jgi:hypothetical protein